jgi:hypothetical protein
MYAPGSYCKLIPSSILYSTPLLCSWEASRTVSLRRFTHLIKLSKYIHTKTAKAKIRHTFFSVRSDDLGHPDESAELAFILGAISRWTTIQGLATPARHYLVISTVDFMMPPFTRSRRLNYISQTLFSAVGGAPYLSYKFSLRTLLHSVTLPCIL